MDTVQLNEKHLEMPPPAFNITPRNVPKIRRPLKCGQSADPLAAAVSFEKLEGASI